MDKAEKIKQALTKPRKSPTAFKPEDHLNTGCCLLNMGISNLPNGGIPKGHYAYFVGDSASGKTYLTLNCLANAANSPSFDDYRLVFDDVENGALMDMEKLFGKKLAARITPPKGTKKNPKCSQTVEEFYFNLDDCMDAGPCVYILDSMDALSTGDDEEKFQERKKAAAEGKEVSGSYGMSKAKANSNNINGVTKKLLRTGSILLLISQVRDNPNASMFAPKKRNSGGKALKFYSHVQIWTSVKKAIKKTYKGKERDIGNLIQMDIQKNRIGIAWEGKIDIPLIRGTGFDDLASCIDWLVDEKHWSNSKGKVNAAEFDFQGKQEELIRKIEEENREPELYAVVKAVWDEIEEGCKVQRKKRYE